MTIFKKCRFHNYFKTTSMENQVRNIAKQYYNNLKLVPFVTSSKDETECASNSNAFKCELNGEEISHFYEEVISGPSSEPVLQPSFTKNYSHDSKQRKSSRIKNKGLSIFHHAQNGDIEGIKYCLAQGCNVDTTDMYNWTPLMCATFEGHIDVVEYLIKCGATLNLQSKQGHTALDLAVQKNLQALIKLLKEGKIEKTHAPVTKTEGNEIKYCNSCNCSYKEPVPSHSKSIAHLLSCQKSEISTYYHIPEDNKGFQIMLKKGWDKNKGLGTDASGRKFPIKTILKSDRTCIGRKKEVPKVTHFGPNDYSSVKRHNKPAARLVREKNYKKKELHRMSRQKEIEFRRQFQMEF